MDAAAAAGVADKLERLTASRVAQARVAAA
jgi:hypothetical protein